MSARSNWVPPCVMYFASFFAIGVILIGLDVIHEQLPRCFGSHCRRTSTDVVWILSSAMEFAADHEGHWPKSLDEFFFRDKLGRKYLDIDAWPLDPWGRPYIYVLPGESETEPHVITLGADGEIGGTGEDEDIDSRKLFR